MVALKDKDKTEVTFGNLSWYFTSEFLRSMHFFIPNIFIHPYRLGLDSMVIQAICHHLWSVDRMSIDTPTPAVQFCWNLSLEFILVSRLCLWKIVHRSRKTKKVKSDIEKKIHLFIKLYGVTYQIIGSFTKNKNLETNFNKHAFDC